MLGGELAHPRSCRVTAGHSEGTGCPSWLISKEHSLEGERKSHFSEPDKQDFSQAITANTSSDKSYWQCTLWTLCDEESTLPLQSTADNPQGKNTRQTPMERHLIKSLTTSPPDRQGHQKYGNCEKQSQQRVAPGDGTSKCPVASWMESWDRHWVKTEETWMKRTVYLIMMCQ